MTLTASASVLSGIAEEGETQRKDPEGKAGVEGRPRRGKVVIEQEQEQEQERGEREIGEIVGEKSPYDLIFFYSSSDLCKVCQRVSEAASSSVSHGEVTRRL